MKIRTSQAQQKILRHLASCNSMSVKRLTEFQRRSCVALEAKGLIKKVIDDEGDYWELNLRII